MPPIMQLSFARIRDGPANCLSLGEKVQVIFVSVTRQMRAITPSNFADLKGHRKAARALQALEIAY